MLASLETPLLGENTAAVAIVISHLLMQTGEPLFPLHYLRLGTGNFPRQSPVRASGPAGLSSPSHSHSPGQPGAGSLSTSPLPRDAPA